MIALRRGTEGIVRWAAPISYRLRTQYFSYSAIVASAPQLQRSLRIASR